ncbi:MAG: hypothetical protein WBG73_02095 [Coleofasciculaceae cyanobacterium]
MNLLHTMPQSDDQTPQTEPLELDPVFKLQVQRLHQLTVYARWLLVALLWVTLLPLSLWHWSYEISLMRSHFTWAALRYSFIFNPLPGMGLTICFAVTIAVMVWHSRNILLGIPRIEQKRLEQQVRRIYQQGPTHPLWKLIFKG